MKNKQFLSDGPEKLPMSFERLLNETFVSAIEHFDREEHRQLVDIAVDSNSCTA